MGPAPRSQAQNSCTRSVQSGLNRSGRALTSPPSPGPGTKTHFLWGHLGAAQMRHPDLQAQVAFVHVPVGEALDAVQKGGCINGSKQPSPRPRRQH